MREMNRGRAVSGIVLAAALLLSACDRGADRVEPARTTGRGEGLVAEVANYELLAGEKNRFIVGLLTERRQFVSGGTVKMRFSFLGEGDGADVVQEAEGTFLHIDEGHGPPRARVTVGPASIGRGVYAANPVDFDRPGIWQVEVEADLGGGDVRTATAAFQVFDEPLVPAPGQTAPRTKNHIIGATGVPAEAIDSRAGLEGGIPDAELHRTTIAAAIEAGRPSLVVFATPVYCVSRFCGPITDMVAALAERYADRAAFIHVEIWRDFDKQVANKAAADWVLREGEITEPWIFLIGADGRILARWDNVATSEEITPLLRRLPAGA
jgi:hypothetical protein